MTCCEVLRLCHSPQYRNGCCAIPLPGSETSSADGFVCDANTGRNHAAAAKTNRQNKQVATGDRKSTRLNSSHVRISYAVFCLKKKTKIRLSSVSEPEA